VVFHRAQLFYSTHIEHFP